MSTDHNNLTQQLLTKIIPILNQVATAIRSTDHDEYRVNIKGESDTSYECFVVGGKVTDESLLDLVTDVVQSHMDNYSNFIPLSNLNLRFADDPPCDTRSCWYLNNRDQYKKYTGSYELRYRHQCIMICDKCKEDDLYHIEKTYQHLIQSISSAILDELRNSGYIG